MLNEKQVLGIIAGGGQFPIIVAQYAKSLGKKVIVAGFANNTDSSLENKVDEFCWLRLGQLGKLINYFKKAGVDHIVFAGSINKPKAFDLIPDFRAAKLLLSLKKKSDNTLLVGLVNELASEGFTVLDPTIYAPELLTPAGILTKHKPSLQDEEDIEYGWPIVKSLGKYDIGQCLVVRRQMVIAVEAIEGTNATLRRAGEIAGAGCVVLKIFKPGQDARLDVPAIGLETIELLIEIKASCLAIEAGKSLFFDREKALILANKHKISVIAKTDDF